MNLTDFESISSKGTALSLEIGVDFLRAYLACDEPIRSVVRDMLEILADDEADADDRRMALTTLGEAIFPARRHGNLGFDLAEAEREEAEHDPEVKRIIQEMDTEEASFATNLASLMNDRGLSQKELAQRIGVGQSAISNMLSRECRPQRRTILRLAEALSVAPERLWASSRSSSI
ncbi:MAG: helix-turn-helix transcriptional regulator [Pirellulaceae bacterium]